MGFRVRLGPLSVSNRGRVGVRAGPVSAYGGGSSRRRGGIVGPILVVALVVAVIVQYWYVIVGLLTLGLAGIALVALLQARRSPSSAAAASLTEDERAAAAIANGRLGIHDAPSQGQQERLRANGLDWRCLNQKHVFDPALGTCPIDGSPGAWQRP